MTSTMVARALAQGLFDKPPLFALSRVYAVMARGVITALQSQASTVVTVSWTGRPCTGAPGTCIGGPVTGWNDLDPDRYSPLVQGQALHFGPSSVPFFFGVGGIVDYITANVTMTDPLCPNGDGTGNMAGGGVVLNATDVFDEMEAEAASEDIMVVNLVTHLGGNPLGMINDPTTGTPLGLGDLFSQAAILLAAVADQLTIEVLNATKPGIPAVGPFNASDPIGTIPSVTTVIT